MLRILGRFSDRSLESLGVLSTEATARAIQRELARSDRTNSPVSLLRVRSDYDTAARQAVFEQVVRFSRARLRVIDEVGQWDDRTLVILLPETSHNEAECVAREYRERFAGHGLGFEISSYPSSAGFLDDLARTEVDHRPEHASQGLQRLLEHPLPRWKRACDVVGSAIGLVLLSPLFLLITVLIKLTSPGPVFYRQRRSGRGGVPFTIYKFRSMIVEADAQKAALLASSEQDGPAFKMKDDPRITPVGKFLRLTSLDELPQLMNVLRGDMTLVGPRPLPCQETAACDRWHLARLAVTPGLTCIWQVHGRSRVSFDDWMRMDLRYIRRVSPATDVKLIAQTLWSVIVRRDGC